MAITGRGGVSLEDAWAGGAHAYLGICVPSFPNMFVMYGPNTNTSGGSIIFYLENQAAYIRRSLEEMSARGAGAIEVRADAEASYDRDVQHRFAGTAWTRCDSWYRDERGRIIANWPGYMREYAQALKRPDVSRFTFAAADRARGGRPGEPLRLRDRRRRLGRVRARQPALRGPVGERAAARGRRQGPLAEGQDPGGLPPAVPHQARLGLRDRAGAPRRRARAVCPPGQDARRLELDERDALRQGAPARLRRLGGTGRTGMGLPRRPSLFHPCRGQRARRLGVPRRRRAAARLRAALAANAEPAAAGRQRGGGDPPHRRLQRPRAGRRLDVPGDPAQRGALQRRRRVPAAGDDASEPRGPHEGRGAGHRARGRAGGRCSGRARTARRRRSCARSAR